MNPQQENLCDPNREVGGMGKILLRHVWKHLTNLTNNPVKCEDPRWLTNLTNRRFIVPVTASQTPSKPFAQPVQVNLYEAKTQLSALVDRAAKGEEIVIAKAGKPMARLVPTVPDRQSPRQSGKNLLGITYIAEDFDAPLPEDVLRDFGI
jgi:prevent-host-death family protein